MAVNPWTDELAAELTKHWTAGLSAGRIAAEMKMTRNMIIGKAHRLKLPAREQRKAVGETVKRPYPKMRRPARLHGPIFVPEPVEIRVALVEPLHLSLNQLSDTTCHYPLGDGPFTFCGHPVKADSSYCAGHHSICFYKPQKVRREIRPAPYPWKQPRNFSGAWA